MAIVIEPQRGHRLSKRKFVGGKWVTVKKLKERRARVRPLRALERNVVVVGDVSEAAVQRMRLAGVVITRKGL